MGAAAIIVHLDHEHLLAVEAETSGGKGGATVRARRSVAALRPAGLDPSDAQAVGAWVGEELKRGGITGRSAVLALPRSEAILKQVPLPGDRPDEADLAELVRLQMSRQLTVSTDGSAIDYLVLEGEGGAAASVLVGAVPGDRMAWHRRMAQAAGLKLTGVELRSFGAAALLGDASRRAAGPVLGVDAGAASVEFVLVDAGEPVFTRSVYLPRPMPAEANAPGGVVAESGGEGQPGERLLAGPEAGEPGEEYVRRVALEAKRTWMSFRASHQGREVDRVAVVGEDDLAVRLRDACAQTLELPGEAVGLPEGVRAGRRGDDENVVPAAAVSLLGVVLRRAGGTPGMDFENPRRPPDRSAKYRAMALAAVFLLLVSGGFGFLFARGELSKLEQQQEVLQTRVTELQNRYGAHIKAEARLAHAKAWEDATVDWLAHVRTISDGLPAAGQVLLDELNGALTVQPTAQVRFEPKNRGYPGSWSSRAEARFALAGSVSDAEVTWALRDRFLANPTYALNITAPDIERRLELQLLTNVRRPESAETETETEPEPEAPSAAAAAGETP